MAKSGTRTPKSFQAPDEQFFHAIREQAQVQEKVVCDADGIDQPSKTAVRPVGKGERRLNFNIGNASGEQRSIEAMKAIENEGEAPFTHRLVSQTFDNIVALLNEVRVHFHVVM